MGKRFVTLALLAFFILIIAWTPGPSRVERAATAFAQEIDSVFGEISTENSEGPPDEGGAPRKPLWNTDWSNAPNILATLLLASILSGLVSFRRRGGTAQMDFTEAHIVLSVAAALMMMIIGSQIARAFGLMGAASIVRYRYSLKSPKEASSLIIALGIGMACGVGLFSLAIVTSLFIVLLINLFEHMPQGLRRLLFASRWNWRLRIRTTDPDSSMEDLKSLFENKGIAYKIKRIRGERGPERDQTEIDIELPGSIDRNFIADELIGEEIVRVEWKRIQVKRSISAEIDE
ncbi:hypothetical protein DRQ36_08610 [bacterium]|nr:MAG: hypothetical protein DRQ36_08610 [bacterium]